MGTGKRRWGDFPKTRRVPLHHAKVKKYCILLFFFSKGVDKFRFMIYTLYRKKEREVNNNDNRSKK